ncbi:MAG: methylmalonyl Co-A mutase-associated GTPase MeaB [Acidobacteria bacterium]|nr:methylmalonyl Co-A mutase-associated GTPase MeaB [Acidobacteriota bacterium]
MLAARAYIDGILAGDRAMLARAITLVESANASHEAVAQEVLLAILPHSGRSLRVGISGAPGVGKSTFIESFGRQILEAGHRVAVLAVDPTSPRTGGSVLGDKTRMTRLAQDARAFIRPSPTVGSLGGVTRRTRESMLLCEAAGFDVILVETVGVGQSETAVAGMVDFFLVLLLASAGDELQGIKRGILELADLVAINKADTEAPAVVGRALADYRNAMRILSGVEAAHITRVMQCSGLSGAGLPEIWQAILDARDRDPNAFEARRTRQMVDWLWSTVESTLIASLHDAPGVAAVRDAVEADVRAGRLTPTLAARRVLDAYHHDRGRA